jgi:hypothetical protein
VPAVFAVMFKLALGGVIAVIANVAPPILGVNGEWITTVNTFMNLVSVYILVKASRAYRQEVIPKTARIEAKVEDVAQAVLPSPWDGKERRGD